MRFPHVTVDLRHLWQLMQWDSDCQCCQPVVTEKY